ncbi:MAG: hypothetical protein KME45_00515 [Stenomitos rutilans HA7619-LM2]|jgi:hypothetical protein|nr:hypothetical protein [Stenomitos rutilans HA7619-LM2]
MEDKTGEYPLIALASFVIVAMIFPRQRLSYKGTVHRYDRADSATLNGWI